MKTCAVLTPETRAKFRPSYSAGSRASNSTLGIASKAFLSVQVRPVDYSRLPSIACSLQTEATAAEPISIVGGFPQKLPSAP